MTTPERLHGRFPVRLQVQFRSASSLLVAYSTNLSRGGMFVETASPPEVGTALELEVETPGTGKAIVRARVTWRRVVRDEDGPPGIGLEFDDLSDALGATIDHLVTEFEGVNLLVYGPDARDRETLRRMLRSIVATAEVVSAGESALCAKLCDESIDLLLIEADDDVEGATAVLEAAQRLTPPIPVIVLTHDEALGARLVSAGAGERVGNPPALADLSRAVLRILGKPTVTGAA